MIWTDSEWSELRLTLNYMNWDCIIWIDSELPELRLTLNYQNWDSLWIIWTDSEWSEFRLTLNYLNWDWLWMIWTDSEWSELRVTLNQALRQSEQIFQKVSSSPVVRGRWRSLWPPHKSRSPQDTLSPDCPASAPPGRSLPFGHDALMPGLPQTYWGRLQMTKRRRVKIRQTVSESVHPCSLM